MKTISWFLGCYIYIANGNVTLIEIVKRVWFISVSQDLFYSPIPLKSNICGNVYSEVPVPVPVVGCRVVIVTFFRLILGQKNIHDRRIR